MGLCWKGVPATWDPHCVASGPRGVRAGGTVKDKEEMACYRKAVPDGESDGSSGPDMLTQKSRVRSGN